MSELLSRSCSTPLPGFAVLSDHTASDPTSRSDIFSDSIFFFKLREREERSLFVWIDSMSCRVHPGAGGMWN